VTDKAELPLGQTNFTVSEIAELAGISQARVRRLLAAGKIRGAKFGRDWQIHRSDVQAWLEARKRR